MTEYFIVAIVVVVVEVLSLESNLGLLRVG
jgi:hypothetical protein